MVVIIESTSNKASATVTETCSLDNFVGFTVSFKTCLVFEFYCRVIMIGKHLNLLNLQQGVCCAFSLAVIRTLLPLNLIN
jgi:hypothetical protein